MSVRHLTAASSEKITLGLGTLNYAFGPGTVAAVVRPASIAAAATILSVGSATTAMFEMRISAAGKILLGCNNTFPAAPAGLPAMTANAWFFAAATKATGTVAPKYHLYVYSTLTWTHIASAATVANSTAAGTRAALGTGVSGAATFWDGDIAAAGAWNVELTDSQIQDLLLFQPVPSKGMWSLNQDVTSGTLLDITGGGADQTAITGTSITSVTQPVGMANLAPPKPFEPWYLSRQAVNLAANF